MPYLYIAGVRVKADRVARPIALTGDAPLPQSTKAGKTEKPL
jgi:hypothetical protein